MHKIGLKREVALVVVLTVCLTPAILMANSREEYAQDLVRMAENYLAKDDNAQAIRLADIVISEFSDTRAVHKAKEIKRLAESGATGKAPTTKSQTVTSGEPDPGKACAWGIIPGGGQFYMANYYRKVNDSEAGLQFAYGCATAACVSLTTGLSLYWVLEGETGPVNTQAVGVGGLLIAPIFWGGAAFTAWLDARSEQRESERKPCTATW
jgi:hypothetical protein